MAKDVDHLVSSSDKLALDVQRTLGNQLMLVAKSLYNNGKIESIEKSIKKSGGGLTNRQSGQIMLLVVEVTIILKFLCSEFEIIK